METSEASAVIQPNYSNFKQSDSSLVLQTDLTTWPSKDLNRYMSEISHCFTAPLCLYHQQSSPGSLMESQPFLTRLCTSYRPSEALMVGRTPALLQILLQGRV